MAMRFWIPFTRAHLRHPKRRLWAPTSLSHVPRPLTTNRAIWSGSFDKPMTSTARISTPRRKRRPPSTRILRTPTISIPTATASHARCFLQLKTRRQHPADDAAAADESDTSNQTPEERRAARRAARQQDEDGQATGDETAAVTCADFETAEDAQAAFDADPEGLADLDADGNGIACEELQEPTPEADAAADTQPARNAGATAKTRTKSQHPRRS